MPDSVEELIEIIAIPLVFISFLLLMYVVRFVHKNDSDMLRSKLFINYTMFRHAMMLLGAMGILLMLHVILIFIEYPPAIQFHVQQVLGLALAVTLTLFAYRLFSVVR
jgi:magnesium-transporting ATPase (P-type)